MLYYFLYPLRDYFSGFNLFRYITFRASYAAVLSLLIAFVIGPWIIKKLQSLQYVETIRDDGPASHAVKKGTPTMGGIIILLACLVPTILFARLDNIYVLIIIGVTIWMGIIGFIDDYLKTVKKMKDGLVARYKMIGQITLGIIVGIAIQYSALLGSPIATITTVPFLKNVTFNYGILFIPMVVFVITATSNAVNLTDGLDGLAIGLSAIAFIAFAGMAYISGNIKFAEYLSVPYIDGTGELTIFCAAMIGAALGFLWYNAHPASVFMGDTGSLPIGAALGTVAILIKKELFLLIVGAVFVGETLSVIIQVASYKMRKKRVFKMAPIHHHFELLGWKETKIVARFYIIGILFALLSLSTFKIR